MNCPYCGKEMRKGYIDQQRMFALEWYPAVPTGSGIFARSNESVKLSSIWKDGAVTVFRCEECRKMIIDEDTLDTNAK